MNENCSDFAFVGANVWQVVEAQAGIFNEQVNGTNPAEYLFQTAAANNISVIRMFAEGTTNNLTLQTGPHSYNQSALKALDQTVAMAGKHGIKLTLILGDTWGTPESIAQFASWSNTSVHNFFLDSQAINLYKVCLRIAA